MKQEQFESPLGKVKWASSVLDDKPATVYDKINRGVFPEGVLVRIGPRCIRFHKENLLAWLEQGGTAKQSSDDHEAL